MKTKLTIVKFTAIALFLTINGFAQEASRDKVLTTIAIGSCSRQEAPQYLWPEVLKNNPDLWIWLGDNIYGDTQDMALMAEKYQVQKSNADYQKMMKQMDIIGIWDDHDYGVNDGGKEFVKREESRDLMFEFLDVERNNPAWKREGGYQSYEYGVDGKKVKILLLDARYFRDELKRVDRKYVPNLEGDVLGEAQWKWLENELTNSDADIHILAGGVQLLPEEHPYEKWNNFPKAKQRLMNLIATTQPKNAFYLSGDRHISEISKTVIPGYGAFYDFTSSGLTHSSEGNTSEPNGFRVSKLVDVKSFGLIKIDWSETEPQVTFEMRGLANVLIDSHKVDWGK
ncbi:alkaline phosphatase D family protein [Roseivirga sp.]|uniref:alkaline phosphatase D family protein n=1 Tax=Roseivirga sp. TaxID=1964215 RepID=UPI002B27408E|nr:alkaline phosphatase D family protein [Roseivirga sp.]